MGKKKQESQCQESAEMVNIYSLIDDTIGLEQFDRSNRNKYNFVIMENTQYHSGSGDNTTGNKTQQNNTYNAPVGIAGTQGKNEIKDKATVAGVVNQYESQKLTEIAQVITELLDYFDKNDPPMSKARQKVNTAKENYPELENAEIIEVAINNNPTVKQRLLSAATAASVETIKVLCPPIGVAVEAIKAYQNPI